MIARATRLAWSYRLATGNDRVDEVHQEFVHLANALADATDENLLLNLRAFERHARAHFGEEDRMMAGCGYPSAGCHVDEHAAVLASVAEVIALVEGGNVGIGRELAAELIRWFPEHTEEMDKSLVRWIARQHTGGAPIVFHGAETRPS